MEKVSLSNKVFSENPLLDEIVYNARQIATGVIVKDSDLADKCETKESLINGDYRKHIIIITEREILNSLDI